MKRSEFFKSLLGIAAGAVIAPKVGEEWMGRDEFEQQYDKPEMIRKKAPKYPGKPAPTACSYSISTVWDYED